MLVGGEVQGRGDWGGWDNCNSIINEIYLKIFLQEVEMEPQLIYNIFIISILSFKQKSSI